MRNVILRPIYNRIEMLSLSIEYEIEARNHHQLPGNFITIFLVEYGTPVEVLDMISHYPFESQCILRPKKFGLTINILEGMKDAFALADDYIVYIEDDILVHKTYFQYLDIIMNMENIGKYSVISPYNHNDSGNVDEIYRAHHYAALAPLITKEFHTKYVYPISNPAYYNNKSAFLIKLNEKYKEHWKSRRYKYTCASHNEQAGAHNRLVDAAMIDEGMYVIMPKVNRQIHIGFMGKNRSGVLPGKNFEERLINLREIIKDPNEMYKCTNSKQYNDYKIFSPKLDDWDGMLRLV